MTASKKAADKKLKLSPAKDLRKYTQQIWLAGLGAFSRAEEEGGKLFDNLVKVGEDLENRTREIADNAVGEVRGKVMEKATDTRERVERAFDERITNALTRLGIPSQRDMELIHKRLDAMTEMLEDISRRLEADRK